MSDAVVGRRGFLGDRCLRDSARSGKLGNSNKYNKEKAAVCSDGPTIRWEQGRDQGRDPGKGVALVLEMPNMIEISNWHETATVSKC